MIKLSCVCLPSLTHRPPAARKAAAFPVTAVMGSEEGRGGKFGTSPRGALHLIYHMVFNAGFHALSISSNYQLSQVL